MNDAATASNCSDPRRRMGLGSNGNGETEGHAWTAWHRRKATLLMGATAYPIPAIYLHLVAVMNYMSLKSVEKARDHLLAAWELARPDDLIEAFGEHHGLLGGMLESIVKPEWPEDFKRIIDITYRFSAG